MNKYPTFSPNACNPVTASECECSLDGSENDNRIFPACVPSYPYKVCMIAGNAGAEIKVHLRNEKCEDGMDPDDPSTWHPLNIAGFQYITMYIRDTATHEHLLTLPGFPVSPMKNGNIVFRIPPGSINCVSGEYEGETEISFHDGRIITAKERIVFEIREDFSGHGEAGTHPDCEVIPEHPICDPECSDPDYPWDRPLLLNVVKRRKAVKQAAIATCCGRG